MDNSSLTTNINSGYYFVPSSPVAIAALKHIVRHAANSTGSEQPSFHMVLCGGDFSQWPTQAVGLGWGYDKCLYMDPRHGNLTVQIIHPMKAAVGGTYIGGGKDTLWDFRYVNLEPPFAEMEALHNNYVRGLDKKMRRQMDAGLWFAKKDDACRF